MKKKIFDSIKLIMALVIITLPITSLIAIGIIVFKTSNWDYFIIEPFSMLPLLCVAFYNIDM